LKLDEITARYQLTRPRIPVFRGSDACILSHCGQLKAGCQISQDCVSI